MRFGETYVNSHKRFIIKNLYFLTRRVIYGFTLNADLDRNIVTNPYISIGNAIYWTNKQFIRQLEN